MTQLSGTQERIWLDRYVRRDESGNPIESNVDETFRRVADAIADDVWEADDFYSILQDFRFVPGGRILAGAGAEAEKTFYNCYVIPIETSARRHNRNVGFFKRNDHGSDSREAIFDTINVMVNIMSRGGGVGINWSVLRPQKSYLKTVSGTSSGPVGWMNVASTAVGEVEQGGSRRGAAMFMLNDWHPDLLRFIDEKRDPRKITNANVSIAVSDAFMEAVRSQADWTFRFPDTTHPEYDAEWDGDIDKWLAASRPVVEYGTRPAREVWDLLTRAAHASGEPGLVFIDRYNEQSTAASIEKIISVNPCGEQGLGPYSVCNLGSVNLYPFVRVDGGAEEDAGRRASFDWEAFRDTVAKSIRFLDNVVDRTVYFIPETKQQQMKLRRIGLGTMGLADALVALGIRYGSEEAVEFTSDVYRTMKDVSIETSMRLARQKGPALGWSHSMWDRPYLAEYRKRHPEIDVDTDYGLRNLFLLTQAPTGTTSLFAGVNGGIEPYYSIRTFRSDRTGDHWVYPKAIESLDDTMALPDYVVTSEQVTVEEHIRMQAAAQKWVDSSVSKTINAPKDQTVEETAEAYWMAYDQGLKGIAYYRDGSRTVQVLYSSDPNERIAQLEQEVADLTAKLNSPFRQSKLVESQDLFEQCPECEGPITHQEGCLLCNSCGWSAC